LRKTTALSSIALASDGGTSTIGSSNTTKSIATFIWGVVLTEFVKMLTFSVMKCGKIIWGVYGFCVGRDSSVGIVTRYGLDGPGNESR